MLSEYTSVLNARSGSPVKKSVSARLGLLARGDGVVGGTVYILEEAQQIGDSFPFAVGEHWVVYILSRASCGTLSVVRSCTAVDYYTPPQQDPKTLEHTSERPMAVSR